MKKQILFAIITMHFLAIPEVFAQQQEMYTFCTGGSYSYLIDTAGSTSNYFGRWTTNSTAYSAHFLKDTIYQTSSSKEDESKEGGTYSKIKKWACSSTTAATCVWTYTISNAHHDICPMPNGNVLVIVYDSKTSAQVTAAGGTYSGTVKSEKIQEIHPTSSTTGTVVWEWKLWDHLCQNTSSSYPGYVTSIAANPQLMNVNCSMSSDWLHMNGIDYNPTLDQIVVSSHALNEIYIIDHSTTTAQAATHTGGNAGKGGDFLYRWGRPQNYGCTTNGNGITINVLHDVRWVPANNSKYPNYISFFHNNGGSNAHAVLFLPPHSTTDQYNYTYTAGSVIPPISCTKPTVPTGINAADMGGVHVLDNGNILITNPNSKFYECNGSGSTYQTVTVGSVMSDRLKKCEVMGPFPFASTSSLTTCTNNSVTLSSSAKAPLQTSPSYTYSWSSIPSTSTFSSSSEQNPTVTPSDTGTYTYIVTVSSGGCSNTASVKVVVSECTENTEKSINKNDLNIFPNPTTGIINLNEEYTVNNDFEIIVYNSYGENIINEKNSKIIDLSEYKNGIYYVTVKDDKKIINKKIILIK